MENDKDNKRVLLLDEVDDQSANRIIRSIIEINIEDDYYSAQVKDYKPEPIRILINSYGGSVYDGLGVIGAIEASNTPVHTMCFGSAMSMALFILASGHYRSASRYSTLMYHEISTTIQDKMSGIEDNLTECKRIDSICDTILVNRTKFKKKDLDLLKKKKSDWFFTPETAKEKGLIDAII